MSYRCKYFGFTALVGLLTGGCGVSTQGERYSPAFLPQTPLANPDACKSWDANGLDQLQGLSAEDANSSEMQISNLLAKYVSPSGEVAYSAWTQSAADLSSLKQLVAQEGALVTPGIPQTNSAKSILINLYNLATLDLVLRHFNELPGEAGSPIPNQKSIQNIGDLGTEVWNQFQFSAGSERLSLNQIESRLRQTRDPRIHFAVNCASKSCPPLLPFAFTAATLELELDERTCRFVNSGVQTIFDNLDPTFPLLITSAILEWYKEDFGDRHLFFQTYLKAGATPLKPELLSKTETGSYLWELTTESYDWSLNESGGGF